jgi:hypothetical protein
MADGEAKSERERRLAEALRANLKRRKAQVRSRRAGDADGRAGLPAAENAGAAEPPSSRELPAAHESVDEGD